MAAAVVSGFAQTPSPTPDRDVVRISTNLIRIDVTVTDAKGKAIPDLRRDEIEIFENGEKQKITDLRFVSSGTRLNETQSGAARSGIPVPTAQLRPEQVRRTVALVVDDLNLSWESVARTRQALKKFVAEQMEPGDLVAIIRTGAGIGALQQFTADKRILNAAIDKVKWNALANGGISAFAPLQAVLPKDEDAPEPEPGERTPEGIEREFRDFREGYFSTGTLGALEYVVRGMSVFSGRKSVVFFSDGFRLSNTGATGFLENSRAVDPLIKLIEHANRASVVVYAMDPRGLVYTGLSAADDTAGRTPGQVDEEMSARRDTLSETQQSLRYIAEETGGFALINNNDLIGGVRRVLEDQSYYLISYEPESETFDPAKRRFNKLDVKVARSGAKVRYRSGFFSVPDRETPPASQPVRETDALGQLERALVSPFSVAGINVRLNALFGSDQRNPAYVRSLLHINANDLTFVDAENGKKKAVFEVLAMSFGDNGQPIDQLGKSYTLTVSPESLKKLHAEGFVYHFMFPVKKAGPYQYRVAIRDTQSGRLGSASEFIEVPDVRKKRLTLSSLVLENVSVETWQAASTAASVSYESNPMTDTALKRARAGSVLRFGFEVYNARADGGRAPRLTSRIRIFRDGALLLDGKPVEVGLSGQTDMKHIKVARALALGKQMTPGDYILQVIVTDATDSKKEKVATQFVQFELVD